MWYYAGRGIFMAQPHLPLAPLCFAFVLERAYMHYAVREHVEIPVKTFTSSEMFI
jgi:hypothetical protein